MKNEKSQLKIGVILNYINIGLGNLIPIFYTPIMLNLLGQSEYGLYKLSSSITSYLSLISFGIGTAVTRYLIKYKIQGEREKEEQILGLFILIFRVIAALAFVIGFLLTMNLKVWYAHSLDINQLSRMQILVFLMTCNMSISFLSAPYISIATAHEEFVFVQSTNIILTCIAPIANLIALYMGFASVGMAISSLAINIFVQIIYILFVRYIMQIRAKYKHIPIYLLKEILGFSFWIFVSNVVGQLYNATDSVMIGAVPELATKGTAIYNIGIVFVNIVGAMSTGLSGVLTPKTNRMVFSGQSEAQLTDFAIQIGRLQAYIVALFVTGFIAFGKPFICFYTGKAYMDAYWVAILIMIPNMIPPVQNIFLNIIIAQNKHQFRSLVYLGIALLNVIGTWILLKPMGIIGAALVSGIALFIGAGIVMNLYYWKKIGLEIPRFWKEVGKIFIWPCIMCVCVLIIAYFVDLYKVSNMLSGIALYTIIFIIFNWKFIMNQYEKEIIILPIKRLIKK